MDENNILVSIIVPVYGTEAYLPSCIESLCNQTYSNLQIILIDDQSPDQCPEICDEYAKKDARIMVIHQKNMGVSYARNVGLRHATGEYIMFVDSDDEMSSDAVAILLKDILTYKADIAWAPLKRLDKKGNPVGHYKEGAYTTLKNDEALLSYLDGGYNMDAVWGKIFRFDFIKDISFEEGRKINEDGFFMFQCYMKKPILIRHCISIYQYNIRPDSSSRQVFSEKYLDMLYFCEKKKELVATYYPQYIDRTQNMEMITCLQFLDILCSTTDKRYKEFENRVIKRVRELKNGYIPFNKHYGQLVEIVALGLYPIYKKMIRLKYYK